MMDTSMARHQIQIEDIKTAIQDGSMDIIGTRRTLLREIEHELEKPSEEVNMEYVNACQDFLMRLESKRANAIISHYNENLTAICKRTGRYINLSLSLGALRPIAALCIVFIVLFGGLLFPNARVITSQSPDHEHYLVQGVEDPIGSGANANANDEQVLIGSFVTTEWSDIVSLFGYAPSIPTWLPMGWELDTYKADFVQTLSRFSATYVNPNTERYLLFDVIDFYDIETLHIQIEQNGTGTLTVINNGLNVYITSNVNDIVAVWYIGQKQYMLTGPISSEEALDCINSIYSSE